MHNIAQYKSIVGNRELAVVIKSNAYGHGMLEIARLCQENQQVDWLCTVNLVEALFLRQHGMTKPLLVLSYLEEGCEQAIIHDIDFVVYDRQRLHMAHACALKFQKKARIHIKVDTGLSLPLACCLQKLSS